MTPDAVRNGIDEMALDGFRALRNMRVGLVTNHSGVTLDERRTIDVLHESDECSLDTVFAPEHGVAGSALGGDAATDGVDATTGLPVIALHGARDRPGEQHLVGLDAVLFDVGDVGCRLSTCLSTLGFLLEACAEAGARVYVLDRPNPLDGVDIEGPSSDAACESRTNYHPLPLRHGLTMGEAARLFNSERRIGADLRVATMAGWQRDLWQDQTGQPWVSPSPNIGDLDAAAMYSGIGVLEDTNVSVGHGTDWPFRVVGAPWIDGASLAKRLVRADLPAMSFEPVTFVPSGNGRAHAGEACHGVRIIVHERADCAPSLLGLELIRALREDYAAQWDYRGLDRLLARPDLLDAIEDDASELEALWQPDPDYFDVRAKYLLY